MKKLIALGLAVVVVLVTIKLYSMEFMFPYNYGPANLVLKTLIGLMPVVGLSAITYWLNRSRTAEMIGIASSIFGLAIAAFFCLALA